MKKIPLSQGLFALVDNEWFDYLNQWKWCASKRGGSKYVYAIRNGPRSASSRKIIWMHRVITGVRKGMEVDHINGNRIDNRMANLRICRHVHNLYNRGPQINNTSGYKGVNFNKQAKKWRAQISRNGKHDTVGEFSTPKEAALAYDKAAREYHGEFAFQNFPKRKR